MATLALPPVTLPTTNHCVICLVPNPTISQSLFDCTHCSAFCEPCHYRASSRLRRCPLCRSARKTTIPEKVHIAELIERIDSTSPQVSYQFLAELSALMVKKVERLYASRRTFISTDPKITAQLTAPVLSHLPNFNGHVRPWHRDENATTLPPNIEDLTDNQPFGQGPLLHGWITSPDTVFSTALKVHSALADHPVLTIPPQNKPVASAINFVYPMDRRCLSLYADWLNFTYMGDRYEVGPLQNWMTTNDLLILTDFPTDGQSQKEWAMSLVVDQLNVLNWNAVNVANALRWRESTSVCAKPGAGGIYGLYDHTANGGYFTIRHAADPYCRDGPTSLMANIDFGIPLSRSLDYVAGPYAFAFDYKSLSVVMDELYPIPNDQRDSVPVSMMPNCFKLGQVLRHQSLGDASLTVTRYFNKSGLRRAVYRLACGGILIATAMRVCGNIYPGNKKVSGVSQIKEESQSAPSKFNVNFEKAADDSTILLSSNVTLADVEIVAPNPNVYLYKVASVTPVPGENLSELDVSTHKKDRVSFPLALVKLWVHPQAKVAISPSDSKVRASSAKVVAIVPILKKVGSSSMFEQVYSMELAAQTTNTNELVTYAYGAPIDRAYNFFHNPNSVPYVVDQVVVADNFTNDLESVCVPGIHGFCCQSEAVAYGVCMNSDRVDPADIDTDCLERMDRIGKQ